MRKLYKGLIIGVPVTAITASGLSYVVIASQSQTPQLDFQVPGGDLEDDTIIIDKNDSHSTLYTQDLYDDIRIVNGNAIIDDDMIGKILSKLIHEAHFINYDGVFYNYQIINATEVLFTISWPEDGIRYKRNYLVNVTKDL